MKLSDGSFIFFRSFPLKTHIKTTPNLAKKEISKEILSFVRFALEKAGEKKYNTGEHE